jgi:hypothetical protein
MGDLVDLENPFLKFILQSVAQKQYQIAPEAELGGVYEQK